MAGYALAIATSALLLLAVAACATDDEPAVAAEASPPRDAEGADVGHAESEELAAVLPTPAPSPTLAETPLEAVEHASSRVQDAFPDLNVERDSRREIDYVSGEIRELFEAHGFEGARTIVLADGSVEEDEWTVGLAIGMDLFADPAGARAVHDGFRDLRPIDHPVAVSGLDGPGRFRTLESAQVISTSFVHGRAWVSLYLGAREFDDPESAGERLARKVALVREGLEAVWPTSG